MRSSRIFIPTALRGFSEPYGALLPPRAAQGFGGRPAGWAPHSLGNQKDPKEQDRDPSVGLRVAQLCPGIGPNGGDRGVPDP